MGAICFKLSMKLTAELAGTEHALELERDGVRVVATVDDRRYEIEARAIEPGIYLLQAGGRVYECRVGHAQATSDTTEVQIGSQVFQIALSDPKRLRHTAAAGAQAAGRAQVLAAMPGKVVRVIVTEGAQVEAGDALLVVEAMKMQNEMKSPKSGTVVELHATAGATVNAGDVLVVVE
ncbi:MAG: acetyl-CoA carboxylase biotin carboxyl carrier protein subunit [Acidobacteria bacterium]|nr:MAG: acetyl-CoA carboxylase biotin carboxyl carrier protein subunit [Acidobacteriota bacterium]